ncbi:uncharacterized protein LOC134271677 [Saccostrea cucullata]|uniref:uncharacterized protein LOC134271677 n=1 Tax=Saccostrea cuccullata TaxID=36930 RepID=UPI002ED513A6
MRINVKKKDAIRLNDKEIEDVEAFLYLGATMDKNGGTEADIGRRLGLARTAFASLAKIWKSAQYSTKTKLKIFNTNVLSVLLYCAELWRTTEKDDEKLDTFHRKCLRRILKIHWPEKITNQQLYERTRAIPLSCTIKRKRWRWIGHILRREENSHIRTALTWAPEGKRRRGRPKNTWRRSVEREREELGWNSWKEGQVVASDRRKWRSLLNGLMRPPGHGEDK